MHKVARELDVIGFFFTVKNHVLLGPDFVHVRDISAFSFVKCLAVLFFFFFHTSVSVDM